MSPDDETRSTPPEGEDFAALFEASLAPAVFKTGQLLKGVVVLVRHDVVLVDVGGKGEATMDRAELLDDDGELTVGVGDTVEAVVVSTSGGVTLSHKLAQGAATRRQLSRSSRSSCQARRARRHARWRAGSLPLSRVSASRRRQVLHTWGTRFARSAHRRWRR